MSQSNRLHREVRQNSVSHASRFEEWMPHSGTGTWCGRRDSNPHSEELVPKTSASANSATPARLNTLRALIEGFEVEHGRLDA